MLQIIWHEHAPRTFRRVERAPVALTSHEHRFSRKAGTELDEGNERGLAVGGDEADVGGGARARGRGGLRTWMTAGAAACAKAWAATRTVRPETRRMVERIANRKTEMIMCC